MQSEDTVGLQLSSYKMHFKVFITMGKKKASNMHSRVFHSACFRLWHKELPPMISLETQAQMQPEKYPSLSFC